MYTKMTSIDTILSSFNDPSFTPKQTINTYSRFHVDTLEDGKQQVTINTTGHNPKDITVNVVEDEITIKATKSENTSQFVKDIDLTLTVGSDYDGTKTEAKFENGLLILTIEKKLNKKAKSIKISY
jgi:HSP20 family molecular chaperone IbpA